MTRGELRRREQAVISGFVERDGDKAFGYIQEIISINANDGVLFRFRPPRDYEIDTLADEKIYLCRPSVYEDSGDCEILFDIQNLCKYFMTEIKPEKYTVLSQTASQDFYDSVMREVELKPEFIALKEKIRDQVLVACFSELYSEKMWKEYASDAEGICLMYNLKEIVINLPNELKFYPVRYVENRKEQKDIFFNSNEYNNEDDTEPEHLKFMLSCLTKDRIPYSDEAEWRLFFDNASLPDDEKGKAFEFKIKPYAIITGVNIHKNPLFHKKVIDYAISNNVKLIKAQEIIK